MSAIPDEQEILRRAESFFAEELFSKLKNKIKLYSLRDFEKSYNPFLVEELASRISGDVNSISLAKALVYPRVLGTSISTSFGTNTQKFIVSLLGEDTASGVSGMDIEFISPVDNEKHYCQIKAGPQTINKDDIETIDNHFIGVRNLARTNHFTYNLDTAIVGVLYGEHDSISSMYLKLETLGYKVLVGEEFWHFLTGYDGLYAKLIQASKNASRTIQSKVEVDRAISRIAAEIDERASEFGL